MIHKCLIQRKWLKNWRLIVVFGGSGNFIAVFSQFLHKHHKSNCHTKAHCCNSFFGWVPALFLMVSKSCISAPSPLYIIFFISSPLRLCCTLNLPNLNGAPCFWLEWNCNFVLCVWPKYFRFKIRSFIKNV